MIVKDCNFIVRTQDDIKLRAVITMPDTLATYSTTILYLPNPNHSYTHISYIRHQILKNMKCDSSIIISFMYRGFHTSGGTFDLFHPNQYSLQDTLLVLNQASTNLESKNITPSENCRVVLIADGLSILLAKQLLTTSYTFSHIVCLENIPDCVENLFSSTYSLQHKHVFSTFRFISYAKLPISTKHAFRKLKTPYGNNNPLFPVIRGVPWSQTTTLVGEKAYNDTLHEWKVFMEHEYPHLFEYTPWAFFTHIHYFFQISTRILDCNESTQYDSIQKLIAQNIEQGELSSVIVHVTDKWAHQQQQTDVDICISRMCEWYTSNKTNAIVNIDIGCMTTIYNSEKEKPSQKRRCLLLYPYATHAINTTTRSRISTSSVPFFSEWYYVPTILKTNIINRIAQIPLNVIKPLFLLEHSFKTPSLISGHPVYTMNITSVIEQHISISILLFHRCTGETTPWLNAYEYNITETNRPHTVKIILPFVHNTLDQNTILLLHISRHRSTYQIFKDWFLGTLTYVDISNVWVEFPIN